MMLTPTRSDRRRVRNRDAILSAAETLFGAAAVEREPWKTSSVRGVTIRLVSTGKALMRGGYLKLLRAGL